mmetsp:Transcript_10728/g.16049  ORF Transcript_10728/g.16049 Transcript_10728/m.16049 type:complete len:278 (+) Transcript_10728:8-841(+)
MSITVSTSDQILKAPTNNSKTKLQYSFSRAARFPSLKTTESKMYQIPPSFSKRATSFGFGNKYDFTQERGKGIPAPNSYNTTSDFSSHKPHSSAFSFGVSREAYEKVYVKGHFRPDPVVPGPGSYNATLPLGSDQQKVAIRPEVSGQSLFNLKKGPGPGDYEQKIFNSKSEYYLSTYKNPRKCQLHPNSSQRFPKGPRENIPGPGNYYRSKSFLDSDYFLSTNRSSGTRGFSISSRDPLNKRLDVPGPGNYRIPSEFGYYQSKNAHSRSSSNLRASK